MEKSTIRSVSKSPDMNQYIFTKDDTVPKNLYDFFTDLGINEEDSLKNFLVTEDYHNDGTGERFGSIKSMHDWRYNLRDDIFDIDVFIGQEKVILVIRSKENKQKEISEKLFKVAKFSGED